MPFFELFRSPLPMALKASLLSSHLRMPLVMRNERDLLPWQKEEKGKHCNDQQTEYDGILHLSTSSDGGMAEKILLLVIGH
jgi:hypothetical protein